MHQPEKTKEPTVTIKNSLSPPPTPLLRLLPPLKYHGLHKTPAVTPFLQTPSMAAVAAAAALLLLLLLPTALSILNPVDYLALQSLRKSLSDLPGSHFLAAWDFTADPCSFPGVLCSSARVTALALGDPRAASPGLSGRLDSHALSRLSSLAELSLVPGRVAGPLPSPLPTSLRFLALSSNLFSGAIPPSYSTLHYLHTLDLSSNRISGAIPQHLPSVTYLVLKHNQLTGNIPSLPSKIRYLDLSFNRLTGRVEGVFGLIERVDLSHNWLDGRVPAGLAAARVVYLNDNRFSGVVPAVFGERVRAGEMRLLYLQRNYLTGMAAAEVPAGAAVCLQYNCMGVRLGGVCPLRGRRRPRPVAECRRWNNKG